MNRAVQPFIGPPVPPELSMTRGERWSIIRSRGFWLQRPLLFPAPSLLFSTLQAPMGIWSRPHSATSRGTSDVQQWLRNREQRAA